MPLLPLRPATLAIGRTFPKERCSKLIQRHANQHHKRVPVCSRSVRQQASSAEPSLSLAARWYVDTKESARENHCSAIGHSAFEGVKEGNRPREGEAKVQGCWKMSRVGIGRRAGASGSSGSQASHRKRLRSSRYQGDEKRPEEKTRYGAISRVDGLRAEDQADRSTGLRISRWAIRINSSGGKGLR